MTDHFTTNQTAIDASSEALALLRERHPTLRALIVITRVKHGWGFAVHGTNEAYAHLPGLIEEIAMHIREDGCSGSSVLLAEQEFGLPPQD